MKKLKLPKSLKKHTHNKNKLGRNKIINISSESGSIAVFVLVILIFYMIILLSLYKINTNEETKALQAEKRIKEIYGKDINSVDDIYRDLLLKDDLVLEERFKDNTKVQYVVNYPVDIDGDGRTEDDWQVFYIKDYEGEDNAQGDNQPDKGRRVFLIASDYVKILEDPESAIQKSMKKSHMVQSSDENKKDYVLTWEDLYWVFFDFHLPDQEEKANIFPKLFEESLYKIWEDNYNQHLEGSKCAVAQLCTDNWLDFVDTNYADYAIGGPTYAMWINSWNMRHPDKKVYYKTNDLGYLFGMEGQDTNSYVLQQEIGTDPLYFPHGSALEGDFNNDGKNEYCAGYWGASPCGLYNGNNVMMVGSELGLTDHWGYDPHFGVRPVVCLKANAKLTQVENTLGIENAECFKIQ